MNESGYVRQLNPRKYASQLHRSFQGDAAKYKPRVPAGTYGGGSWRPPNTVSAPAPEPRIPQWKGSLRKKVRKYDWIDLINDLADGIRSGRQTLDMRKARLTGHIARDLAQPVAEWALRRAVELPQHIEAIRSFRPVVRGGWKNTRVCRFGGSSHQAQTMQPNHDTGCLVFQILGQKVGGPILRQTNTVHYLQWTSLIGTTYRGASVSSWTRVTARQHLGRFATGRGGIIGANYSLVDEALAALAPGLFPAPAFKSGAYAPMLNRGRLDLSEWPQAEEGSYGAPWRADERYNAGPTITVDRGGITVVPPGLGLPEPPGPRRKERKFILALDNNGTIGRIVGAVGEFGDFVESFYAALPDYRKGDRTVTDKLKTLYRYWNEVDIGEATKNLIYNHYEDAFYGRLGRLTAKANRRRGSSAGLTLGPAL